MAKSKKTTSKGASALASQIVSEGHPALREMAKEVPADQIQSPEVQELISRMKAVLDSQHDGIGLAAPQIGVSRRIFVVSKKVFGENGQDAVFINPVITKESKEKKWMEGEGCLSVRWVYGKVKRSTKVSIRALNEKGEIVERGAGGLLAHIFQHEVDHLNGILFIDRAKDLEHVDPKEVNPVTSQSQHKEIMERSGQDALSARSRQAEAEETTAEDNQRTEAATKIKKLKKQ